MDLRKLPSGPMGKLYLLQALWGFVEVSRRTTETPGGEVKDWSMAGGHVDQSSWCSWGKAEKQPSPMGKSSPAKPAAPSPAAVFEGTSAGSDQGITDQGADRRWRRPRNQRHR